MLIMPKTGTFATPLEIEATSNVTMVKIRIVLPDGTQNIFTPPIYDMEIVRYFEVERDSGHCKLYSKRMLPIQPSIPVQALKADLGQLDPLT